MLTGKTAVITGCLQGIGRETLRVFAENGANVYACVYKQSDEFDSFCENLNKKTHTKIVPLYFDMNSIEEIKGAVKTIMSRKEEIDAVINIAGVTKDALFPMITATDMLETFQINYFSQIILTQYLIKIMNRNKTKGSVVFTSSTAALDGISGQTTYAASKAALIGAMRCMAIEYGERGIRVNAVAPGVIKTPMTDKLSSGIIEDRERKMNLHRIGKASEVANVYLFLASDLSSHITGQVIRIDGGTR